MYRSIEYVSRYRCGTLVKYRCNLAGQKDLGELEAGVVENHEAAPDHWKVETPIDPAGEV
jgi:hypothetical protein